MYIISKIGRKIFLVYWLCDVVCLPKLEELIQLRRIFWANKEVMDNVYIDGRRWPIVWNKDGLLTDAWIITEKILRTSSKSFIILCQKKDWWFLVFVSMGESWNMFSCFVNCYICAYWEMSCRDLQGLAGLALEYAYCDLCLT